MPLSVSALVLRARQLEAEAIQRLAQRVELVDAIGQCMDALQRERGATSIYLASGGARFADERRAAIQEVQPLESQVRALMAPYLEPASGAQPKLLSLMAWVLLDLDALSSLRQRIDRRQDDLADVESRSRGTDREEARLARLRDELALATGRLEALRLVAAFLHVVLAEGGLALRGKGRDGLGRLGLGHRQQARRWPPCGIGGVVQVAQDLGQGSGHVTRSVESGGYTAARGKILPVEAVIGE